ncbi:Spy/CpxP family protein refolding chaperone [Camelimonas abortus]|uniref:Spy/CpxP family protein refolding chaperone n=1 Tax=Camelimonas abortus TaxID=1017184 RepID=A0ABV7LGL9_9HYPH
MNRKIAALALGAALVASGAAFAQQAEAPNDGAPAKERHLSADDRAAFLDARIAALKAGLKLNADQEKLWPAVEKALRDQAKERAERMAKFREERKEAREEGKRAGYPERLRKGADMAEAQAATMRRLADAIEPLYNTLSADQQRRLRVLLSRGPFDGPHRGNGPEKHGPRR